MFRILNKSIQYTDVFLFFYEEEGLVEGGVSREREKGEGIHYPTKITS
jgi:hypothetical protein